MIRFNTRCAGNQHPDKSDFIICRSDISERMNILKRILSFFVTIFMLISGLFTKGADYKVKYTDKTVPLSGLEAVSDGFMPEKP